MSIQKCPKMSAVKMVSGLRMCVYVDGIWLGAGWWSWAMQKVTK